MSEPTTSCEAFRAELCEQYKDRTEQQLRERLQELREKDDVSAVELAERMEIHIVLNGFGSAGLASGGALGRLGEHLAAEEEAGA